MLLEIALEKCLKLAKKNKKKEKRLPIVQEYRIKDAPGSSVNLYGPSPLKVKYPVLILERKIREAGGFKDTKGSF